MSHREEKGIEGEEGRLEMVRRRKRGCNERPSFEVNKAN